MGELLQLRRRFAIGEENLIIFNQFRDRLRMPVKLNNGDLQGLFRITCYGYSGIYTFTGKVMLVNHGFNTGRAWIDDGEEGFGEENFLLGCSDKKYSLGRSGRELVVETPSPEWVVRRIDMEEWIGI